VLDRFDDAVKDLGVVKEAIRKEMEEEFTRYREQIGEQIEQAILARHVPESILRRKSLDNDPQVKVAIETVKNRQEYCKILQGPPNLAEVLWRESVKSIKGLEQEAL